MMIAGVLIGILLLLLVAIAIVIEGSKTELDRVDEAICCLYSSGDIDLETANRRLAAAIAQHSAR